MGETLRCVTLPGTDHEIPSATRPGYKEVQNRVRAGDWSAFSRSRARIKPRHPSFVGKSVEPLEQALPKTSGLPVVPGSSNKGTDDQLLKEIRSSYALPIYNKAARQTSTSQENCGGIAEAEVVYFSDTHGPFRLGRAELTLHD